MTALETMDETQLRIDLAAALRLSCREGWHEGVANHFSAAVSADGKRFLINPRWMHWSRVRASDLVLCDAEDATTMDRADAPDPSAWSIHSALHREVPQARVALHLHPPHATALAALKDPTIHPIDQVTARWYKRIAYDLSFGGIASEAEEGARIARSVGTHQAVMMQNHGVTTFGATVAEAWDALYHLERAARTLVLAYSTGQSLAILPDALAEATAAEWQTYKQAELAHFAEMKRLLERDAPDYKD
ncbi:class II aldolase/adducin family protein [Dinoroseobacter sp. S76]|uniref:class II aldolase/adducin family protein n=1 Tax=Dinoroseobacter sp. S76 TaxID=3415124 RepID=UPI003C7A8EC7